MRFIDKLDQASRKNNSLLCVGLDIDLDKIPPSLRDKEEPLYHFGIKIVDETKDLVCAYKPNMAFYEMYGSKGLDSLIKTIDYIHKNSEIPVILDAKRGDIGNSSRAYAKAVFETFRADAVTVNPYMGKDSLEPFIEYKEKGVFVLCLTSNPGSQDFQPAIYKSVAQKAKSWNQNNNCGLVVGATKPEELKEIQKITGDMPILIPGVGTQGGDLEAAVKYGGKRPIINASRSVIYAADPRAEAAKLKDQINKCRQ